MDGFQAPEKRHPTTTSADSTSAPFQRLFPELLIKVFHYYTETSRDQAFADTVDFEDGDETPVSMDLYPFNAPLKLTHVCRTWRSAGLGDPRLWTKLKLVIEPLISANPGTLEQRIHVFEELLNRSGALPVDLEVIVNGHPFARYIHQLAPRVIDLVMLHRKRWKRVDIRTYCDDELPFFVLPVNSRELPMLEEYRQARSPLLWTFPSENLSLADPSPPLLRSLRRYSSAGLRHPRSMDPVVDTACDLPELPEHMILWYAPLLESVRIEDLDINCPDIDPIIIERLPSVTLPRLQDLHIHFTDNGSADVVLDRLTLPSLRSFSLGGYSIDALDGFPSLTSLFQRSESPLTHLQINLGIQSGAFILDVLRFLPNLNSLDLTCGDTRGLLRSLIITADGLHENIIPQLSHLTLRFARVFQSEIISMITSRWNIPEGGAPEDRSLSSITLVKCFTLFQSEIHKSEPLRTYCEEGLALQISG